MTVTVSDDISTNPEKPVTVKDLPAALESASSFIERNTSP
jgi:hypothetical protein